VKHDTVLQELYMLAEGQRQVIDNDKKTVQHFESNLARSNEKLALEQRKLEELADAIRALEELDSDE
jgi:hypothetical protein